MFHATAGIQPKAAREISEVVKRTGAAAASHEPNAVAVYPRIKRLLGCYLAIITAPHQGKDYLQQDIAEGTLQKEEFRGLIKLLDNWYEQGFLRHRACFT
jgi:hypothetical protein